MTNIRMVKPVEDLSIYSSNHVTSRRNYPKRHESFYGKNFPPNRVSPQSSSLFMSFNKRLRLDEEIAKRGLDNRQVIKL